MNLAQHTVLVTGAGGFIGSHLTQALLGQAAKVKAFVHYNSSGSCGWLDSLPSEQREAIEIFSGDVRDPNGVREALRGCHSVFHLAALIAIPYSYHSPDSYVDTNIKGTLNILQAARDLGIERVVQTSTSETYGTAQFVPITEEHPLNAQSPYAATKIAADQLALSFHRSFGTPVTVVRPFNTYGPRQSTRAVIPTIITQLAKGADVLRLGALSPTRDFSYVGDTAKGFITLAKAQACVGEVVNLGSGFEISIGDTAALLADMFEAKVSIECERERLRPEKSEVERLFADTTKARKLADFAPEHPGLEGFRRGLAQTVAWFTDPENLKLYRADRYHV